MVFVPRCHFTLSKSIGLALLPGRWQSGGSGLAGVRTGPERSIVGPLRLRIHPMREQAAIVGDKVVVLVRRKR